jgi:hypothetical protein
LFWIKSCIHQKILKGFLLPSCFLLVCFKCIGISFYYLWGTKWSQKTRWPFFPNTLKTKQGESFQVSAVTVYSLLCYFCQANITSNGWIFLI